MDIEELIHTYGDYLYRIAFIYTKDESAAEEIVQDVFFNFYRKQAQYNGYAALKTYLVKMAVNRSYDYLRSWKNKRFVFLEKFQGKTVSTEKLYLDKETRGEVTAVVLTLPIKYREVLLLYYYEEMTVIEIANILETAPSTIKSRLQRARAKLKPLVTDDWEVLTDE